MRECNLKKIKTLRKIRGSLPKFKRCFFGFFFWFVFGGFVFFSMFLCFCFAKRPKKAAFPVFSEFFFLSCSPERPGFKSFFSSYLFLFFLLSSLSIFHISLFLSINPLFENIIIFVFFIFLAFCPFLMFACFFETNFPNIPFFSPSCFRFWLVIFSSVGFLFMVYVSAFLFLCWFVFGKFLV